FSEETEFDLAKNLLQTLNTNKKEGETIADFQDRIQDELNTTLDLEEEMKE
ncbi:hypothetical protein GOV03_02650, partial [Candidatus Woesearchaeota archaeon]|nr:hypothetical protein [Candidatus Woesearchaeota archaeon]